MRWSWSKYIGNYHISLCLEIFRVRRKSFRRGWKIRSVVIIWRFSVITNKWIGRDKETNKLHIAIVSGLILIYIPSLFIDPVLIWNTCFYYNPRSYRNSGYPAVGYYAGRSPHLLVVDPIATKEIFIKNFAHFNNNEVSEMMSLRSDPLMARNPFFQKSDLWKTSRKELVPGFTNNRVKTFFPIIKEVCEKLLLRINTCLGNATGAEIDIDDVSRAEIAFTRNQITEF